MKQHDVQLRFKLLVEVKNIDEFLFNVRLLANIYWYNLFKTV